METALITPILENRVTWIVAAIAGTFFYWYAAIGFALDFDGAVGAMDALGFSAAPAVIAVLTIIVQLLGSALVIHGRFAWLGAGMLAVFTLLTIPMVHDWWNMEGAAAVQAKLESQEHLTVVGGLVALSVLGHLRRSRATA